MQAFFSQANSDGVSVRSHLTELIHRLLQSKDPDALKSLESLSLEVKASHFKAETAGQRVRAAPLCAVSPMPRRRRRRDALSTAASGAAPRTCS